jgi:predicted O-methyltransferase YrrM
MADGRWSEVDDYLVTRLVPAAPAMEAALAANAAAGLPPHDVSPTQGRFLYLMARLTGARRILEIGTLGGYSTIWLARALEAGGLVVSIEANPHHAEIARANLRRAGVDDRVELRVGDAHQTLPILAREDIGPFDMIFIDADKPSNPVYLDWAMQLARPGSLILVDNVVRDGAVSDPASQDPRVIGVRQFFDALAADSRLEATAIQTVGSKGWDGFALIRVR